MANHTVVYEKYTYQKIGQVKIDNWKAINQKISLASTAYETTKIANFKTKHSFLTQLIKHLKIHQNTLALLICEEAGKPYFYAQNEVERCIKTIEAGLQSLQKLKLQKLNLNLKNTPHNTAKIKRFPIGIIVGISPFNFPLNLALHKIIPAICAGNTILIKPSPLAPLTLDYFIAKIIPPCCPIPNWIQIIHCSDTNAQKLTQADAVKMISFTGSATIGWSIKNTIGKKKIALELGGNAAIIVDKDSNLSTTAEKCCFGAFLYSGQICIATQRIFVHEEIFEPFIIELLHHVKKISSGNPKENVINGPLISKTHLNRIANWVDEAVKQGAKIICGGAILNENNNLYEPTFLTNTTPNMKVVCEEIFGPVAIVEKIGSFDEGIYQVNNSKYGLQTGVFTLNKKKQKKAFENIDCGAVIINNIPGFRIDEMPYGGIKDSGLGREGISYAIEEQTELKLYIE